ncbi:hypothetical protein MIR68_012265 [Amoeboaphelidium protococcarum]|nr:hypothetical protein MIR68_012265 [Amoeboaphelidium protococcarum]
MSMYQYKELPIIPGLAANNSNSSVPQTPIKLAESSSERETYENQADLYAIVITVEQLEKAYIRDSISADQYTQACAKLLTQYKTAFNLVDDQFKDIDDFCQTYYLNCQAALNRLKIGVPATIEHAVAASNSTSGGSGNGGGGGQQSAKYVAEAVQSFITLMDSLKLEMRSVDHLHPLMGDLLQSLNKVGVSTQIESHKQKLKEWLIKLNQMKAADELDEQDTRQLMFDLETAHGAFYRALSNDGS